MNELATTNEARVLTSEPSTGDLLAAVIQQGITTGSVEVIERLCAVRDKERAQASKADFNRDFFALKKELSGMSFYCDKEAKTKNGVVAYTYCSESEIAGKLDPVMFKHGFAMLFGQRQDGDRITSEITLIHESGHEEKREYTVTRGRSNDMKDATAVDASATTSAWRHLVIKLFGLKSRIREDDDARNEGSGETISAEEAKELQRRVRACGSDEIKFLAFAGANSFLDISADKLQSLLDMLARKEREKAAKKEVTEDLRNKPDLF